MINRTKIALAVALFAAFATPALAHDGRHHSRLDTSYASSRLIESRNMAMIGNFGGSYGTWSGRDAMVQSLGN